MIQKSVRREVRTSSPLHVQPSDPASWRLTNANDSGSRGLARGYRAAEQGRLVLTLTDPAFG